MGTTVRSANDPARPKTGRSNTAAPVVVDDWLRPFGDSTWVLRERRHSHAGEPAVEACFSIGNGRLGVRGGREEDPAPVHPRTFVAGLFDELDSDPPIPALVPAPEWFGLRATLASTPLRPGTRGVSGHVRTLDLRRGALLREWDYRDEHGQFIHFRTLRFASVAHPALAVHIAEITAAQSTVISVDQPRYSSIELTQIQSNGPVTAWETRHRKHLLTVARMAVLDSNAGAQPLDLRPDGVAPRSVNLEAGKPITIVRVVAMARESGGLDPDMEAMGALQHAGEVGVRELLAEQAREWERRWETSGIQVSGDDAAQRALRFAVYHLIIAANPGDERTSIGARGLTGEAYWGHVFWDTDIFLMPFYTLTWPEAARAMLMYRYHGLSAARAKAQRFGYRGALYAWEAAEGGEEATPDFVFGFNGERIEIKTGTQEHHITADVAYAVWQYWQATGDDAFLLEAGAEIVLETARFWASRAKLENDGCYHIRRVVGPDEYHEDVDDNAYTNGLAQWNLRRGVEVARLLRRRWPDRWQELSQRISLGPTETRLWGRIATNQAFNTDPASGVLEQFAGYFDLDQIDLAAYEPRTQPMDVLLGRAATHRSQVIKQADVVMLMNLLSEQFSARQRRANFRYYEGRCGHGSSLSPAVHAVESARLGDVALAQRYFRQAAAIDLDNSMGNAADGVHMATQGGIWQAAVFGFAGLQICRDGLRVNPHLPASWSSLTFRVQWQGRQVQFTVERRPLIVTATLERGAPLIIHVGRRHYELDQDQALTIHSGRPAPMRKEPRRE